jgi:alpha-mannosidase
VAGLKPSDDGKALIVRLFAAGGKDAKAKILWTDRRARQAWLSDTSERPGTRVEGPIEVPAWGLVTVRVDR